MKKSLSILIPSLDSRAQLLSDLACELIIQCGIIKSVNSYNDSGCIVLVFNFDTLQIIIAKDQKGITTGAKRNLLLRYATCDYVVSVDDDDKVPEYFVRVIYEAIQSGMDVYATNGVITTDGKNEIAWYLSKDNPNKTVTIKKKSVYLRTSNHLSPVKRELAIAAGYPDISNGEDKAYSEALNPLLKTEGIIEHFLYHYQFSSQNKEYK